MIMNGSMTDHILKGDRSASCDELFQALPDGTRRALLQYLVRAGDQSVHALTAIPGVSQPLVSRHPGNLVSPRHHTARQSAREPCSHTRAQDHPSGVPWRSTTAPP